jgi:uncharacterized protein YegP (UPF0339 family)
MRPKSKKTGKIIKTIKGKKGKWEIYSYKQNNKTYYANRLVSANGWIICDNTGFIKLESAEMNIGKIKKLA